MFQNKSVFFFSINPFFFSTQVKKNPWEALQKAISDLGNKHKLYGGLIHIFNFCKEHDYIKEKLFLKFPDFTKSVILYLIKNTFSLSSFFFA